MQFLYACAHSFLGIYLQEKEIKKVIIKYRDREATT